MPERTRRTTDTALDRRTAFLGELRTDRRFRWILALYLIVVVA